MSLHQFTRPPGPFNAPTEPRDKAAERAEARDQLIRDRVTEIFANGDLIYLACRSAGIPLSRETCILLAPIDQRLDREPPSSDGDYRRALRSLLKDLWKAVWTMAAEQLDEAFGGDAA